jgi:3-methylcrotonyl-CoA carboxylase alpha subunit
MIAKVITHGPSRAAALTQLGAALDATRVAGSVTNLAFLRALTRHEGFAAGAVDTGLIDRDLAALTAEAPPEIEAYAAAAIAALGLDAAGGADARDPFAARSGWRIWGDARMHATLVHEGVSREALVLGHGDGRFTVTIEDESVGPFRVRRDADGLRMIFADAALSLDALRTESGVTLFHEGRIWRFETPDPLDIAAAGETGGDRIVAPMPGLVKALMTEAGAMVEKGQTLAILEAMKMEHRLTAPRDGVIAEIAAAAGDQIDEGALLIALVAEEGAE